MGAIDPSPAPCPSGARGIAEGALQVPKKKEISFRAVWKTLHEITRL